MVKLRFCESEAHPGYYYIPGELPDNGGEDYYPADEYEALERRLEELKEENGNMDSMYQDRLLDFEARAHDAERRLVEVEAERDRLRGICFEKGVMFNPPCFNCGYNGPGYFQPDKHPCAAFHHAALRREEE